MSDTADIQTKPKPARDSSKDKRTLDQVEKWMEMIREISREPIDARIDLHGMTQQQAHAALLRFLHRAQASGAKTALVVTGKGLRKSMDSAERDADYKPGVLKRQVPMWLALPEFRLLVVGFDDAHVGHGGEGALYVRLRRGK